MKKITLVLCGIFLSGISFSQTPDWLWAKGMGGTLNANYDEGHAIATDALGNIYATGRFEGTADFDPGPGVFNLISAGGMDIFISKSDSTGNFIWAKAIGSIDRDEGFGIAIDAAGNVYTTGGFGESGGTADFDPGPGIFNLTPNLGSGDIFISKLDASGNFVWAKQVGGFYVHSGKSIVVDASANVYTTGGFSSIVDFDPGAGVFNMTSSGGTDVFILKLTGSGDFVWAKQIGASGATVGTSIALDPSGNGNIYATGWLIATADFDPGPGLFNLTSAGDQDIFVVKLDASANLVWAKLMGGTSSEASQSLVLDPGSGNIYTTGNFQGTADFDPGAGTFNLSSAGTSDVFISKLDGSGNFVWAKQIGGISNDVGNGLTIDPTGSGAVYTTGYFTGTVDFDPGAGTFNLTSEGSFGGSSDIFVSKLDGTGNFAWAKRVGGGSAENSYSITTNATGNVFITGYFWSSPISFGLNTLTTAGGADIFIAKVDNPVSPPVAIITAAGSTFICPSQGVTLYANTGTGLLYQWRLNSTNISGATSWMYSATAAGNYECLVSNTTGSSISNPIIVTSITVPTAVITAGGPTTFCSPGSVMLSANTGTGLSYQWRLNSGNISGATSASYVAIATGNYDCRVTNTCGSTFSNVIAVTGNSAPTANISASGPTAFCSPGSVTLSANTGTGLSYQWQLNNGNISGATSTSYVATVTGNYDCRVTNTCGSTFSNVIAVTDNSAPTANISASGPTTFCSPLSVTLNANTGTGLTYQWRLNGGNISGATASTYSASASGSYDCIVTNACGSTASNIITVTVSGTCSVGLLFNGSTSRVTINDNASYALGTGDFTLEAWIKASSSQSASVPIIVSKRGVTSNGFILYLSSGKLSLQMAGINFGGGGNNLRDNTCHHVAVSREVNTLRFYVDGTLILTQTIGTYNINSTHALWLGRDEPSPNPFNGLIHEFRFWNLARSQPQIVASRDTFLIGAETGLIGYWRMNEGTGQTIQDYSINNNSGVLGSSASIEAIDPSYSAGCLANPCPSPSAIITAGGLTTVCSPATVILNANTGSGLTYQWRLNGGNISGATASSYTATSTGNYDCIVSNSCASTTSNTIGVTVNFSPTATINAAGATTFCSPGSVTLNANTGSGLTYQWQLNSSPIVGATAASYVATTGGNYDCVVSNSCGSATSNSIVVTVNLPPPAVVAAGGATTFCDPGSVTLDANTGGGLTYQWRLNGVNIAGETSASYSAIATGNYDCVVTNTCGSMPSNLITVQVDILPSSVATAGGPTTFCAPGSVTLNVSTCIGCIYQWRESAVNISGANSSSYLTTAAGNFDCVVTNTCGARTSNNITVTIAGNLPAGSITASGSTTFCSPGSVTLNANTGSGLTYQWRLNGGNISGATSDSYSAIATGNYDCIVSNACGSTTSNSITVIVNSVPSASVTAGGVTTFCSPGSVTLNANIGAGLSYQWRLNSVYILGATSVSYVASAGGSYDCVVSNTCGSATSNAITVTVNSIPSASITAGGSTTFCSPGSVLLNANTGTGLSYQWRLNGGNISGATSSFYTATATGNYDCIVSNLCGSTTSNSISVTVNTVPPATITAGGPTTFCSPASVTLSANTGTGLSYQWKLNGVNIAGATASSYSASSTGSYQCIVTNVCGSITSSTISVTVVSGIPATPGSITGQSAGVCASTKPYSIVAVSGATSYAWTVPAGVSISSGQGTINVNVAFINTFGSGNISVTASNSCGTSAASSIAVTGVPAQPGNITGPVSVCHNQSNVNYSIAAVTGATSYTWTAPAGANIVNGQGNLTIKVKFGNSAGNITVKANNACGSGPIRSLAVAMPCREGEEISENNFNVNVFPNPSNNDFTFMIDGAGINFCSINIFDLTGRVVEAHQSVSPNREFKCGNALTDGIYYAEIISGSQKKVVKLIEQR